MWSRLAITQTLTTALAAFGAILTPGAACAQNVQITKLSDVAFGLISNVTADQTQSQSVCAYSGLLGGRYAVTATGSGTAGAFTLTNGTSLLPYEVQWNGSQSGQTSGTNLVAGTSLTGQTMLLSCPVTQATNASLILILRGASLSTVSSGSYSGTLTIILSAN